jgi:hypothetical protein
VVTVPRSPARFSARCTRCWITRPLAILGDSPALDELEADPQFVIGRLFQALTALLERDVPPMDATARLLDEAICDAIEHRRTTCPKCTADESCAGSAAN